MVCGDDENTRRLIFNRRYGEEVINGYEPQPLLSHRTCVGRAGSSVSLRRLVTVDTGNDSVPCEAGKKQACTDKPSDGNSAENVSGGRSTKDHSPSKVAGLLVALNWSCLNCAKPGDEKAGVGSCEC